MAPRLRSRSAGGLRETLELSRRLRPDRCGRLGSNLRPARTVADADDAGLADDTGGVAANAGDTAADAADRDRAAAVDAATDDATTDEPTADDSATHDPAADDAAAAHPAASHAANADNSAADGTAHDPAHGSVAGDRRADDAAGVRVAADRRDDAGSDGARSAVRCAEPGDRRADPVDGRWPVDQSRGHRRLRADDVAGRDTAADAGDRREPRDDADAARSRAKSGVGSDAAGQQGGQAAGRPIAAGRNSREHLADQDDA